MTLFKPRDDGDELVSVWSLVKWTIIMFVVMMGSCCLFLSLITQKF
jgi:hypothetical protein